MSFATPCRGARRVAFTALLAAGLACSGGSSGGEGGTCPLPAVTTLAIAGSTPSASQTGVAVNGDVVIRFNTCLDPTSIPSAVTFTRAGTPVPATISYDASRAAIVIHPAQPLAYTTTYTVTISSLVRGAHGEVGPYHVFSFTTQATPETVPPTTSASPPGGFYNATQHVTLACQDNAGGTGCAVTRFTMDGSTPSPASAAYVAPITVDHSLTLRFFSLDAQGNAETPRSETYVMDTDPPGVVSVFPPNGATSVRLDTPFRVAFDEPMRDGGALRGSIAAVPAAPGGGSYDAPTRTVTVQPTELLECNTTYTLTVSGATDLAGNALPAPTTWSFTTAADCDEPRTAASVDSGAYPAAQDVTLTCTDGAGSGCARIVYTTDGSAPSFDGGTGIIVQGPTATIHAGPGETVLRYRAEDGVGHVEVIRESDYSVSLEGFVYVAAAGDLLRGAGKVPSRWFSTGMVGQTLELFRDGGSGRLYRRFNPHLGFSDDGGVTWHHFTLRTSDGVQPYLTAAAADGSRIYVGTDKGLFVSIDGGASFQERHYGIYDWDTITSVALSGKHVFVGTRYGLIVSHDRMRTWARRADAVWFTAVATCGDHVYATRPSGVDVSHDAGVTWTTVTTAALATANRDVACDGTNVYVATNVGLAISTDSGDSFGMLRTTAQGLDTSDVSHVAASGANVYAATIGSSIDGRSLATSTNSGAAFTARSVGIPGHNPDPAAILVEGNTVWVGAFPSLWRSTDAGVTFAPADLTGGITRVTGTGTDLYALVENGSGYSGIAVSHDRGRTWPVFRSSYVLAGQGPFPSTQPEDLFLDAGTGKLYVATSFGLAISSDGGTTFNLRTGSNDWNNQPNGNAGLNGNSGECVAASGSTVWYGTSGEVQKSTNGGQSFDPWIALYPHFPYAIAFSGQDVYVAASGGLEVSNNSGATFALRTESAGIAYPSVVHDVFIASSGNVYVADSQQVEVSTDHGANFTPLAATAGTFPQALLVTLDGALWVGCSAKLGVSTDAGATFTWWDPWNGGVSSVSDVYFGP